jgi:membrane associated rhomboid family serine protease
MAGPDLTPPNRERAFNAPWPLLIVVGAILALYLLQSRIGADWPDRFGLRPADVQAGQVFGLLTYVGVHDGWLHAGSNAIGALAFGAPLSRRLGESIRGAAILVGFFLLCGVLSGAVYALVHPGSPVTLIGSSGAVFGLIGAATRLMNPWGRLDPLRSRRVLGMTAALVGANLVVGALGFDPATGVRGIAWEAHIFGLVCGLLLVGPLLRLAAPPPAPVPPSDPPPPPGPWSPSDSARR